MFYIVENADIRYKEGTAGVLYCSKSKNKIQLGIRSIENAETRYGWWFISLKIPEKGTFGEFFCWKGQNKVLFCAQFYRKEGGWGWQVKCNRGEISRFLKIVQGVFLGHSLVIIKWTWVFFSQILQFDLTWLGIHFTEKAEISYGWGIIPLKLLK